MIGEDVARFLTEFTSMPGVGHLAVIGTVSVASALLKKYLLSRGHYTVAYLSDQVTFTIGGLTVIDLILKFAKYAIMVFGIV